VNPATNQLNSAGFSYDGAGNLTADGTGVNTHTYQWDAEGHLTGVDSGATRTRVYNALGWDIEGTGPGFRIEDLYDPAGQWIGRYDGLGNAWSAPGIFHLGGRFVAFYVGSSTTWFVHANALDSTSIDTYHNGSVVEDVLFYPWGQFWVDTGLNKFHFAGTMGRDTLLDMDVTPARMYSSGRGRWLTPDPVGRKAVTLTDPHTWNMYAYARNNPTTLTDPSGLCPPCEVEEESVAAVAQEVVDDVAAGAAEGGEGGADRSLRFWPEPAPWLAAPTRSSQGRPRHTSLTKRAKRLTTRRRRELPWKP